jgi:hypothetical protein
MLEKSEVTKLVDEILSSTVGSHELATRRRPQRDICALARRDFAPSLRKHFGRDGLRDVLRVARKVFPNSAPGSE